MGEFEIDERVDIKDVVCPMTFVKAKVAMEELEVGQILSVTMNDGEPVQNVPRSFTPSISVSLTLRTIAPHSLVSPSPKLSIMLPLPAGKVYRSQDVLGVAVTSVFILYFVSRLV